MMRSRYEGGLEPLRLSEGLHRKKREVVRLQFRNSGAPEDFSSVESGLSVPEAESQVRDEVIELRQELSFQQERFALQLEEARKESAENAKAECIAEFTTKLEAERTRIDKLFGEFEKERANYFASAEAEVVKLALAIAAQVLHREAQLDPLLLSGVVRVALDQIQDGSDIVLRVPIAELDDWRRSLADCKELQVQGDERLSGGDCVLESNLGRAELGIRAQLKEIGRGFFDLLEKRPA